MTLRFGQTRGDDVATLIARRQYVRAIEVIKEQLETQRGDPRVRIQLGDVLALAGRPKEAVAVLSPLADEFARDGFAAKAIAILKKIQKLDPDQRDVEARLASLIREKQQAVVVPAPAGEDLELEIGFGAAPVSAPAAVPEPPRAASVPAPVEDRDLILEEAAPVGFDLVDIEVEVEPDPIELDIAATALEAEPLPDDPRADADFAQELLAVIEDVFPSGPAGPAPAAPAATAGGQRIVVSPLFQDFAVDEMVAIIQGLRLLTFERGDVILREGERGDSVYMLASGRVRAFIRAADGRQQPVGDLAEGAFFGEISILTGQPRTATIVAASRCELLELDRATLDAITGDHPRVWDVMREFANRRARRA
jgi:hypothetical protein